MGGRPGSRGGAGLAEHADRADDAVEGDKALPIVDAHHHLWDLTANRHPWLSDEPPIPFRYGDYAAIRRNYLAADYKRDSANQNIVASVYVEAEVDPAQPLQETDWISRTGEAAGLCQAIVAQAWLDRDDAGELLAAQAAFPKVRGIRHKPKAAARPQDVEPGAPGSMGDPRWRAGYAQLAPNGLSFDLQAPWWHLAEAAALAEAFPETQIILNHTGLPADRSAEGLAGWRAAMTGLARCPNVAVKISGIGRPGLPWTVEANRGIVLDTIEAFGVERCLFASNFPVDGLVAGFDEIFDGFKTITRGFTPAERLKLFCDNALRLYRIERPATAPGAAPGRSGGGTAGAA